MKDAKHGHAVRLDQYRPIVAELDEAGERRRTYHIRVVRSFLLLGGIFLVAVLLTALLWTLTGTINSIASLALLTTVLIAMACAVWRS